LFNLSSYKVGLSKKQPKAKPYHVGKPSQTKPPRSRTQSLHVHSPSPLRTETNCILRTAKKLLTSHKIESQINSKNMKAKERKYSIQEMEARKGAASKTSCQANTILLIYF
jgi:hypothetical protein